MSGKAASRRAISKAELSEHCYANSMWLVVDGLVYDVTEFLERHPGGDLLKSAGGSDATVLYHTYHLRGPEVAARALASLPVVGVFDGKSPVMGALYEELVRRVGPVLRALPDKPLRTRLVVAMDVVLMYAFMLYSWYGLSTDSNIVLIHAVRLLSFGYFWGRISGHSHANGHQHYFGRRASDLMDHVFMITGVHSPSVYTYSKKGNMRKLLFRPRSESQFEWKTERGPAEHVVLHHQKGADLKNDACARLTSGWGQLRISQDEAPKPKHRFQTQHWYQIYVEQRLTALFIFFGWRPRHELIGTYMRQPAAHRDYVRAFVCLTSFVSTMMWIRLYMLPFFAAPSLLGISLSLLAIGVLHHALDLHQGTNSAIFFGQHQWDVRRSEADSDADWGRHNVETCWSWQPRKGELHALTLFTEDACPATLSYHLEHTLFPGVNYLNLSKLAPTVEQVCGEFGIKYPKLDGMAAVLEYRSKLLEQYATDTKSA